MNYSYLAAKVQILRKTYQETFGRLVNTNGEKFIKDLAEFGCHIIASDSNKINSEKQRLVIKDCLNVTVTASDIYRCKGCEKQYIEGIPSILAVSLSIDSMAKLKMTQSVLDLMSEFAYCIMCADEKFSKAQELYLERFMNSIVNDGNLMLRHYKLNKPMPTMIALCENPQLNPFKQHYLYNVNERTITNELTAHKIPTTPIYEQKSFGDPFYVALYPSNSIQGNFAVVSGKNLYILNLFEISISDYTISLYNDMEGIHKSIMGAMVGGPAWGAIMAAVSQNHMILEDISITVFDKAKNEEIKIVFASNEKFYGDTWASRYNHITKFSENFLSLLNKVTKIEMARKTSYKLYGRECDTLTRNYLKLQGLDPNEKHVVNAN